MLDIPLASVDDLLGGQTKRDMTREREILAARLLGNHEKRLAGRVVVNFNKIHTSALQQFNRGPAILRGLHAHSEWPVSWRIIENRSCREDARSEHTARRGRLTQIQNEIQVGSHVADPGHSVRHIELEP